MHYNWSAEVLYWQGHFALITNFDLFLGNIRAMRTKSWFCQKCVQHFMSEDALKLQHLFCNWPNFSNIIDTLPPPGTTDMYKSVSFQQRMPFVI